MYICFCLFLNLSFQPSPWCFTLCIIFTSTLGNLPKFFEFFLIYDGDESVPDFWTTNLSEDPRYIRSSSYNELIITGIFPLLALCYYNYEIYARIRLSCFIELGRYVGGKYNSVDQLRLLTKFPPLCWHFFILNIPLGRPKVAILSFSYIFLIDNGSLANFGIWPIPVISITK